MFQRMLLCLVSLLLTIHLAHGATANHQNNIDVQHYSVTLEPDIAGKAIKGTVVIKFLIESNGLTHAEFDCGDLTIDSVRLAGAPAHFAVTDHRLKVSLPPGSKANQLREVEVHFHGRPRYGIRFFPDREQVYTVFSTSQWMVCVDDPADKATLTFRLILPRTLTPVANGNFVSQRDFASNKRVSEWRQETAIPTYIFGFCCWSISGR